MARIRLLSGILTSQRLASLGIIGIPIKDLPETHQTSRHYGSERGPHDAERQQCLQSGCTSDRSRFTSFNTNAGNISHHILASGTEGFKQDPQLCPYEADRRLIVVVFSALVLESGPSLVPNVWVFPTVYATLYNHCICIWVYMEICPEPPFPLKSGQIIYVVRKGVKRLQKQFSDFFQSLRRTNLKVL